MVKITSRFWKCPGGMCLIVSKLFFISSSHFKVSELQHWEREIFPSSPIWENIKILAYVAVESPNLWSWWCQEILECSTHTVAEYISFTNESPGHYTCSLHCFIPSYIRNIHWNPITFLGKINTTHILCGFSSSWAKYLLISFSLCCLTLEVLPILHTIWAHAVDILT
jgi:hypothetical protein